MNMDLSIRLVPVPAPVPTMVADKRPTADTAALVRDPRPQVPMPLPATMPATLPPSPTQKAEVTKSRIGIDPTSDATGPAVLLTADRVLKPYGVAMLPHRDSDQTQTGPKTTFDEPGPHRDQS